MNPRIVFVEGISGSGKTSASQFLYRQYLLNGYGAQFLHEFHIPHPIHEWDITDPEEWVAVTLANWRGLVKEMLASDEILIMDCTLFQGTVGVLLELDADRDMIFDFAMQVPDIIQPLRPALVYFYQSNYRKALIKIYNEREERIRVKKDNYVRSIKYGQNRNLAGHEGYMQFVGVLRAISSELYSQYDMSKIQIENSEGDWACYHQQLLRFLSLPFSEDVIPGADYVGLYKDIQSGRECRINCTSNRTLEIQGFFPVVKFLCPRANDILFIRGKAHELIFKRNDDNKVVEMISRWYIKESEETRWIKVRD